MDGVFKIAAFGALNQESYDVFREWMTRAAKEKNIAVDIACAGPYPNAQAVTEPGRPLRADALKDPALKDELLTAVAGDAKALGKNFDVYCMPCMSMIGFHDGVEQKLGTPIMKLADALMNFYAKTDRVGVIHMRPAKQRVEEMFGHRAMTPNPAQSEALFAAEEQAKKEMSTAPVEAVMEQIVKHWKDLGVKHVLFARADAPAALKSNAARVPGIQINSYFDIFARAIAAELAR
jgi:hypothetical protein